MMFDIIKKYRGFQRCLQKEDLDQNFKYDEFINNENSYFKNKKIDNGKKLKIDKKINSILGWVPYIEGKTSIVIYNFFSTNYSLRKNLILKISVLKNHSVILSKFM